MNKQSLQTIIVESDNTQGVLYRIAGIFLRRKINIEHLEVHTVANNQAHFTIEMLSDKRNTQKIVDQINKIIGVHKSQLL